MRCLASEAGDGYRSAKAALTDLGRLPRPDDAPATAAPAPSEAPTAAGPTGPQTVQVPSQPGRLFPLDGVYLGQPHPDIIKQIGVRSEVWDV